MFSLFLMQILNFFLILCTYVVNDMLFITLTNLLQLLRIAKQKIEAVKVNSVSPDFKKFAIK